jgi:hypothetical protein
LPGGRTLIDTISSGLTPNTVLTYLFNPSAHGLAPGNYFLFIEVTETRSGIVDTRGTISSGALRVFDAPGLSPPSPPQLIGVQTSGNPVSIRWVSASTGGAPSAYAIAVGTSPGASNGGVFPVGLATEITANAPVGIPLYVRIVASNAAGSAVSNELIVFVGGLAPPSPPSLNPVAVVGRTVTLGWNTPTVGGPPDFYVLIGRFPGNPAIIAAFPTTARTLTIPGVPPGDYLATVVAVNGSGVSAESNAVLVSVR